MDKTGIQLSDHFDTPTLLRFTVPSILMMVISSVYSIVDGLFISNFAGSDGFAAVNLMMPIAMLVSCVGFMAGAGGSALVSKTLGEGKQDEARWQFSLIMYLSVGFSLVMEIIVFIFIPQIAHLLGAEGVILENCIQYGRILVAALPAFMLQILFQNFLVVAELPKTGMVIAISSGITNIILDALFVAVFRWGVAGAAAATVTGQMIGGLVPLFYFLSGRNRLLRYVRAPFNRQTLRRTASNGLSAFISNASASVIGIVFNLRLMELIGPDGVVAYGVAMYVNYIVTGVFMGYSTGIAPVFSYHLGAKNREEIRGLFRKSLVVIGVSAVLLTFLVMLADRLLASIFVSYDESLMALTTEAIRLYSWSFLICGFNLFATTFFAALNNGPVSSILSLTRTLFFQVAAVYLLPLLLGQRGIWLSVSVAEILALGMAAWMTIRNGKRYGYLGRTQYEMEGSL